MIECAGIVICHVRNESHGLRAGNENYENTYGRFNMMHGRFSKQQIVGILKEREAGVSVAELGGEHGMSDADFYEWKARYGGERKQNPGAPEGIKAKGFCREAWRFPGPGG